MHRMHKTSLRLIFIILVIALFAGFSASAENTLSRNDRSNAIVKKGSAFVAFSQETETDTNENNETVEDIENSSSYNNIDDENNGKIESDTPSNYPFEVEDLINNYNNDDILMTFRVKIDGIDYDLGFKLEKSSSNSITLKLFNNSTKNASFNNKYYFESKGYYVKNGQKQVVIKINESDLKIGDSTETRDNNIISHFSEISDIEIVPSSSNENEIPKSDTPSESSKYKKPIGTKPTNEKPSVSENVNDPVPSGSSELSKEKSKIWIIFLILLPVAVIIALFAKNNTGTKISNKFKRNKSDSENINHENSNPKNNKSKYKANNVNTSPNSVEIAALKNIYQAIPSPIIISYPKVSNDNIFEKAKQSYQKPETIDFVSISNNYDLIVDENKLPEFMLSSDIESDYILKNGRELFLNTQKYSGKYYCCYPGIKYLTKCFDVYDQYGKSAVPNSQKILNIESCILISENKIYKIEKKGKICVEEN